MELIPTILDQLHSEVIVKTALSAAKLERWLEIPFHKLFVLAATGNSWFVGNSYLGIPSCLPVIRPQAAESLQIGPFHVRVVGLPLWYARIPSSSHLTEMLALICSAYGTWKTRKASSAGRKYPSA